MGVLLLEWLLQRLEVRRKKWVPMAMGSCSSKGFFFVRFDLKRELLIGVAFSLSSSSAINDLLPPPSSPTNSSISSRHRGKNSIGLFFHDRSTTLGTLMGVSFPAITFRTPSQRHHETPLSTSAINGARTMSGSRRKFNKSNATSSSSSSSVAERRRRWWSLSRDENDAKPMASLGDFLENERRFGDGAFYGVTPELESVVIVDDDDDRRRNGRLLFADGRVLPSTQTEIKISSSSSPSSMAATGFCR
ncbi:uncharacterized protein At3g17950-like [Cannabis sativa]|uniref:uncharacterized protein At3g17950-like n=1 Tax=Cannabis sativa TaxID=3483 RepID=UPI0029CA5544|nr:uncharacterized protein At3g17950-like [Cannabis sativa]